jgi:predicted SnoaL-like aldol condensation-catalyzing enzyme
MAGRGSVRERHPPVTGDDLFRVQDGMLAEHWDVEQRIPEKMGHANGML